MMKNLDLKNIIVIISFVFIPFAQTNASPMANPSQKVVELMMDSYSSLNLVGTEKPKADNPFITRYYTSLRRGITDKELGNYWSKSKNREFDLVAKKLAEYTRSSVSREKSRLIDLLNVEATCERLTTLNSLSVIPGRKTIKLKVENTCYPITEQFIREIKIRYSVAKLDWEVIEIEDKK